MSFSVLVIHDDSEKLAAICGVINEVGVSSLACGDSIHSARKELRNNHFDVLIIDIALPNKNGDHPEKDAGVRFLEEALRRDYPKPTYVLGVTASEEIDAEVDSFFKDNFWQVIRTPALGREWLEGIERLVLYQKAAKESLTGGGYKIDVFVVCALQTTELNAVLKLDNGWEERLPLDEASYFYKGVFKSQEREFSVCAGSPSKVGPVHMALYVQKVIHELRPRYIAMPGICAGYEGVSKMGDVVVADPAWCWQSGKHVDDGSGFKIEPDQISLPDFVSERLKQLANEVPFLSALHESWPGAKPPTRPQLLVAPTASGSAVLADGSTMELIKKQNRKVAAVEMESYALYASAKNASHPKPTFFCLKSVCDYGDGSKNDDFQAYAAYVSAQVLQKFLTDSYHEIRDFAGRA